MSTLGTLAFFVLLAAPQDPAKPQSPQAASPPAYKVLRSFAVGGDGGWDYVSVDSEARRLYVSRGSHVVVLDADSGKQVGDIKDTAGVHGALVAPGSGHGFTSNGRADSVTVFDSKTFEVQKTIAAGKNPDALVYDPTTNCVCIANGRSHDVSVIDVKKLEVVATIAVGGKPEAMVVDGKGSLFVNIEDTSEVVRIDAKKNAVAQRFALAPGTEPSGLAIDTEHGTLFSACGNAMLVVLDAATGKVLASPKIGTGVDGAAFDAASGLAFASNGEGTLSIVATRGEKPFTVVQTLPTLATARTLTIDAKTHCLYLPCAETEAAPAEATGGRRRPALKKDSFRVLVVGN
jgi:YVTN family beta-propeller protein